MRTSDLRIMVHTVKIKTIERSTVKTGHYVQDNPRMRKRNGVNAKFKETIIAIKKQKVTFLEEAIKNRQPEN